MIVIFISKNYTNYINPSFDLSDYIMSNYAIYINII